MNSWSKWFGALAAVVLLAGQVGAADALMGGKVKSVDTDKKTFMLTDNGKDHTFKLDPNVVINRGGKESKGDLKVGDAINVSYEKGVINDTAKYILVQEGDTKNCRLERVTIKNADAANKRITFTDTGENKDWTFDMNGALVRYNGQNADLQKLKIGDPTLIIVDRTGGKATLKAVLAWSK